MPITERDRQRLQALIAIVKPADSISARLDTLAETDRNYYDEWKARREHWMRRYPDGEAFEKHLDGYGPQLRDDISVALFGETPRILKTDDYQRAQEIYRRYCDG